MIVTLCDRCHNEPTADNPVYNLILASRELPNANINVCVELCAACRLKVIEYMRVGDSVVDFPVSSLEAVEENKL